jgi:hypothetical protein
MASSYRVGAVICERQHNGYERTIVTAVEGHYVMTRRGNRTSRISWRNLGRYRIVKEAPDA